MRNNKQIKYAAYARVSTKESGPASELQKSISNQMAHFESMNRSLRIKAGIKAKKLTK